MPTKSRTNGDGSVYQRHDRGCPAVVDGVRPDHICKGPWVAVITLGYRDKKPIRKKVSASTKTAATAKLRELDAQHRGNDLPEGKPITVEQWMNHWLTQIVPRKAKDKTIVSYTTVVKSYVNPLIGHHRLERLTPEHIDAAWDVLLNEGNPMLPQEKRKPLSQNTVHHAHRVLARSLKVALQRKRVRYNVAGSDSMDAPPQVDAEIEPIPDEDVAKILAAAQGDPYGARWSVALSLGLRPGEALGLRWENVDLDDGVIYIKEQLQRQTGKGLVLTSPKSSAGVRALVLPKTMLSALKAHKKAQTAARLSAGDQWNDTGLVFTLANGKGIDGKVDGERWHRLLDKAGVKQRRLYDARHSAATLMLAQGIESRVAMALLGHSQISVTMKYQHAVDKMMREAAVKMEAGMWGQTS